MELVLPARDRDVAAHHADPRQRRSSRSRRWPIPTAAIATSTGSTRDSTSSGAQRTRRARRRCRGAAAGAAAAQLPYWGKYVFHDNNRDINLSQVAMRAIVDWYFTAHPPIMHDLHEAQPLMYTYSGGPPQNPNLDPILFAELPFFSNFELAQMTKWGMPGVYTHAFMDGWSPGYLGSVAYNHNGMMRMYETQSGRENGAGRRPRARRGATVRPARQVPARRCSGRDAARRCRGRWRRGGAWRGRGGRRCGGRGAAARRTRRRGGGRGAVQARSGARRGGRGGAAGRRPAVRRRTRAGPPTGRGGGQPREWYRGLPIPPDAIANFSRRNNTNYMETGVLSGLQLTAMFPNLVARELLHEDAATRSTPARPTRRTATSSRRHEGHDARRDARQHPARAAHRDRHGERRGQGRRRHVPGRLLRRSSAISRTAGSRRTCSRSRTIPIRTSPPTTTAAGRWGWRCGVDVKEIKDKAILDAAVTPVKEAAVKGKVTGSGQRRHRGRALRLEQHDRLPLQAEERADEDRREELHRGRRRVPGGLVRRSRRRRHGGGARRRSSSSA